jgi:hypothetical protein
MSESQNQIGVKFDDPPTHKTGIATMSTIPSVLIRTCMLNIQKELRQLEHWLNTLPAESTPSTTPSLVNPDNTVLSTLEKLSKQYEVQQHALNHIVDRLDMLEEEREAHHVQHTNHEEKTDPWLDASSSYLENTIVDPLEPIYLVRKETEIIQPVLTPSAAALSSILHTQTIAPPEHKEETPEAHQSEPKEDEEPHEEPKEDEEPQEEEPHEEEPKEEEEPQEEDGVELAEVTFKGKTYYKDPEGFIYGIDEEGQPTEQPIGIWKEKTSSVAFYRT